MKSKFTILLMMACTIWFTGCSKKDFNEQDAIEAQKQLLNLKYQYELDLETLKQKGATAMQQLINTAALDQLKLNDSLTRASAVAAKRQDYSINVVDVITNAPVADAVVTVSSEGKVFSASTNAQGIASFTNLYLFPTSSFLVSKPNYAATQILQQNVTLGSVKLWNTSELLNEISGSLFIETDLTNATSEKVGANVLVTASTAIPNSPSGSYTVSFPTFSTAAGTYSIRVPAAPNSYNLTFGQVTAEQKLYVNATEDDAVTTFPAALPRLTSVTTYYNVNNFGTTIPTVYNSYYFKFSPDNNGRVLYVPSYSYYGYNNNQVLLSPIGGNYQVEKLNVSNYYSSNGVYNDFGGFVYAPNTKIDVTMVDIAGNLIQTPPALAATSNANGRITLYTSPEGGNGYIHLKRTDAGALVPNAKGVLTRGALYDSFNNLYTLNLLINLNTSTNSFINTSYLLANKGDKRIVNFYYGAGSSRAKQVY
ncbi:MAG: hypothetical protein EOP42_19430 [Sphingobacteriaceae bacterium]|nr:MAG: hypothetical protein EOP42_19430 [Sphingobacteriaceae bacterium]